MFTIKRGSSYKGERLTIRGFNSQDAAYAFLNAQSDNQWTPNNFADYHGNIAATANLKPGKYAFAGGQWHNVKHLDASVLAHI